ncbi:hypothetical protein [Abyssalbus ytuae]|uniref:Lipocalin-like domain-containing protein n=1 Tax=Abyssalbus ytuae TaxID=2926907 RepID=A0A9E6ZYN3_9FLAO|nr:hypothetical protein [Abyssalbus ytuae]UOB17617.1 hypothetical protein MQE35_17990 [Abyssalbus ytuae]
MNKFLLFPILLMLLFSCTDNDDTSKEDTLEEGSFNESLLFDKWWYSTSGNTQLFISSTGSFEQVLSSSLSDTGTWEWINDNHTQMKFTVTPGGSNIVNEFWVEYTLIESSSIEFNYSTDNESYAQYSFTDIE